MTILTTSVFLDEKVRLTQNSKHLELDLDEISRRMDSKEITLVVMLVIINGPISNNWHSFGGNLPGYPCVEFHYSQLRRIMGRAYHPDIMAESMKETLINGRLYKRRRSDDELDLQASTCAAAVEWVDLGMAYYPRFIRTAKCHASDPAKGQCQCSGQLSSVWVFHWKSDLVVDETLTTADLFCSSAGDFYYLKPVILQYYEFKEIYMALNCHCV